MPQIILKERRTYLGSYNFFYKRCWSILKTRHFDNSINHQEQFFDRTLITGYFRPVNIARFLRTGFL